MESRGGWEEKKASIVESPELHHSEGSTKKVGKWAGYNNQ